MGPTKQSIAQTENSSCRADTGQGGVGRARGGGHGEDTRIAEEGPRDAQKTPQAQGRSGGGGGGLRGGSPELLGPPGCHVSPTAARLAELRGIFFAVSARFALTHRVRGPRA